MRSHPLAGLLAPGSQPTGLFAPIRAADIKPAYRGINTRDNVEVVDVVTTGGSLPTGEWKVIVRGMRVKVPRTAGATLYQHFSLINDYQVTRRNTTVGWLSRGSYCPEGSGFIAMDDEDTDNYTQSYIKSGYTTSTWNAFTGQYGIWKPGNETRIDFCRDTRSSLPSVKNDYAVLRLGSACPAGGIPFARISDNEDYNNGNSNSTGITVGGTISPSRQQTDAVYSTRAEYCFVPGNGSSTTPPWSPLHLGAISDVNKEVIGCPEFHWHVEDDEDNVNGNTWDFYGSSYASRMMALFNNQGTETHYFYNMCP